MPQLELKNISKQFILDDQIIKAVNPLTLELKKGEFISIVGHSGSGKTTLLSMMGGILSPSAGGMLFDGQDVYAMDDNGLAGFRADKVGYMFQFSSLMPVLTAKENLLLPTLFSSSKAGDSLEARAMEYLDMVGLSEKFNAYPAQLSGGQQRRVAIARALMNNPVLLLADEPTGDLDEETEAEVMALLKRISSEGQITFVLVTHSRELASAADRRMVMSNGTLTDDSSAGDTSANSPQSI